MQKKPPKMLKGQDLRVKATKTIKKGQDSRVFWKKVASTPSPVFLFFEKNLGKSDRIQDYNNTKKVTTTKKMKHLIIKQIQILKKLMRPPQKIHSFSILVFVFRFRANKIPLRFHFFRLNNFSIFGEHFSSEKFGLDFSISSKRIGFEGQQFCFFSGH